MNDPDKSFFVHAFYRECIIIMGFESNIIVIRRDCYLLLKPVLTVLHRHFPGIY